MQIIPTDEVLSLLREGYALSEPKLTPLGKEMYQHVYKIESDGKKYILRLYNEDTNVEKLKKDISVLKFLTTQNFIAPQVIETNKKESIFQTESIIGYLATYIEGNIPSLTEESARQIGIRLAKLHKLNTVYADLPISNWNITDMHRHLKEQTQKFHGNYLLHNEIVPDLLQAFSELDDLSHLPQVLIHTDIGPHNTIQTTNGEFTFIDWDDAGIGIAIIDVAYMLSQVCINTEDKNNEVYFETNIVKAYLDGYTSHRPLTSEEKEHMLTAMKFCTLSYVFQEWVPTIDMLNWQRYQFECRSEELIKELLH